MHRLIRSFRQFHLQVSGSLVGSHPVRVPLIPQGALTTGQSWFYPRSLCRHHIKLSPFQPVHSCSSNHQSHKRPIEGSHRCATGQSMPFLSGQVVPAVRLYGDTNQYIHPRSAFQSFFSRLYSPIPIGVRGSKAYWTLRCRLLSARLGAQNRRPKAVHLKGAHMGHRLECNPH